MNTSRGGVPKSSAFEAMLTPAGVGSDAQDDERHHGGPDRAVVLYSLDVIRALQREGHPIGIGTAGENLTVGGIDWPSIVPGTILHVGDAQLCVTKYATPCSKIGGSFLSRHFMRIAQDEYPGWSRVCARVLAGGIVRPGDPVRLVLPTAREETARPFRLNAVSDAIQETEHERCLEREKAPPQQKLA